MSNLELIRKKINECDEIIIKKLAERNRLVTEVADTKRKEGIPIFDKKREEDILNKIKNMDSDFSEQTADVYREIMKISRTYQAKELLPSRIFLIGFMGAGKTTVGKILSDLIGYDLYDLDSLIEKSREKKIKDIFEQQGEEFFREIEKNTLKEVSNKEHCIISCGGGIILKQENRKTLKEKGNTVFLKAEMETILKRLEKDNTRPLLSGALSKEDKQEKINSIKEIYESRINHYEESADVVIDVDNKNVDEIINIILEKLIVN